MTEEMLRLISEIPTRGFFVTAEFSRVGTEVPPGMEAFILGKLKVIAQGSQARKFVWRTGEWRVIFTFFPTDRVVDEKYALKNKVPSDFDSNQ